MRTTLGRRILGLSGRLSLVVLSVSDIDGEMTSKKYVRQTFTWAQCRNKKGRA